MTQSLLTTTPSGAPVIGASQVAAILGVHAFAAPIQVWQELVGELPPFAGNARSHWGNRLEPVVRQEYVDRHQVAVHVPPQSLLHPELEWLRATPDGIVLRGGTDWAWGLECKTTGHHSSHRWGEPGTDEVPAEYLVQCATGMLVSGLERWDLAVLIGGQDYREYTLERDEGLLGMIRERLERFYRDHVLTRIPPEVDASDAYREYLVRRYPHVREEYREADDEAERIVEHLASVRESLREIGKHRQLLENQLLAKIGDASGLQTKLGKVTCRPRRGAPNWKTICDAIAEEFGFEPTYLETLARKHRNRDSRPLTFPRGL